MKNAQMKVVKFDENDVIATSGVFTLSGLDDGNTNNLSFNGTKNDETKFFAMTGGSYSYWTWEDMNDPDFLGDATDTEKDDWGAFLWNGDYVWGDSGYEGEGYIHQ